MVGKIYHISNARDSRYEKGSFQQFIQWLRAQRNVQFDVETNVTDWWCTRQLVSMQFGSCTPDRVQWFILWDMLSEEEKRQIKEVLEDPYVCKLAHNVIYEYVICRFYGIIMENVYDTMLSEKVLQGGLENLNYALADISWKYLRIQMDKTHQKSFYPGMQVEDDHILYGVTDVSYLDVIRWQQYFEAVAKGVTNVIGLENEAVLAFGDITFEGMILNKEKWRENERLAKPLYEEALKKLNSWLQKEPFKSFALAKGYISDKDRCMINFNSPAQKTELIKLVFPTIAGSGMPILKKYVRDNGPELNMEQMEILDGMQNKRFDPLFQYLVKYHRDYLVAHEYLVPAGQVTINWNSWQQVLPLFNCEPSLSKMTSTSEDERNKFSHPILKDYEHHNEVKKLITDLGEEYINKHVGPDGRVRTNFNQVVSTGRVSSSNPNMQNITVKEFVGTRYRNAFECEPGWSFVSSDFTGQELAIIAFMSEDPVWLGAITNGWDLHSICAEMVYGKKWKDAAEKDCAYYHMFIGEDGRLQQAKQKCNCKKHKTMRYDVKTINFGLAYGMSHFKLAGELDITVKEAIQLIEDYFEAFPTIKRMLEFLGQFGLVHGFIMTRAPFHRKRWFPQWEAYKPWVRAHIEQVKFVPVLGEIERASKNMPIQGTGADMMKLAMVITRNYIRDNNLRDRVKFACQVHDQLDTVARDDFKEQWKTELDHLMCEAARLIIPSGILKAETTISPVWTK